MQSRSRYHIIVEHADHVETIREHLEQSSLTDIRTWEKFPLLFNVSLTEEQAEWFRQHPLVRSIEPVQGVYLHEDPLRYEITLSDTTSYDTVKSALLGLLGHVRVEWYAYHTDRLFVNLTQADYVTLLSAIPTTPDFATIVDVQVSDWKPREYSRVLNLQKLNWGLERVTRRNPVFHSTVRLTRNGEGVKVYVVDTGVKRHHQEIVGRCDQSDSFDAFRDPSDPDYGEPSPIVEIGSTTVMDDHGTHVASLIAGSTVGVAPAARVISVRMFSNFEETTTEHLLDAIDYILTHHDNNPGPGIVNLSLAFNDVFLSGMRLSELITGSLIAAGLVVVVSAGNDNTDSYFVSPANAGASREVVEVEPGKFELTTTFNNSLKPIVVGASVSPVMSIDGKDAIWHKSNFGDVVDLFAPGVQIYGASLGITTDGIDPTHNSAYAVKDGTSMSAPIVTGIAALLLEAEPSLTHLDVRNWLIENSTRNMFSPASLVHDRVDPTHYDSSGNPITVQDKVLSPNRLAFAWFIPTEIEWIEQDYTREFDEQAQYEFSLRANSYDMIGDSHRVEYLNEELDVPSEYSVPGFLVFNQTTQHEDDDWRKPYMRANFRINAPSVTASGLQGSYILTAYDGRMFSSRVHSIGIVNVPAPPVFQQPAAGLLTPTPAHKGDLFDENVFFFRAISADLFDITYTYTPVGGLPPGLQFINEPENNRAYLRGRISRVPYSSEPVDYEILVRATDSNGGIAERLFVLRCEYLNEAHYFSPSWLASLYDYDLAYPDVKFFAEAGAGNSFYKYIDVVNTDADELLYTIEFVPSVVTGPGIFNGVLPTGLGINNQGEIQGIVDPAAELGLYFFRVVVEDQQGISIYADFVLRLVETNDEIPESDQIIWITPAGSIGQVYETFASHLYVEAQNPVGNTIKYSLVNGVLPSGMEINTQTGEIRGIAPFVEHEVRYYVTIRASVGSRYVDRDFYFDILNQYDSEAVLQFKGRVQGPERLSLLSWATGQHVARDAIFRPTDPNFGAIQYPYMYLVSGTSVVAPAQIQAHLADYHKRMFLRFGSLSWAPAYEPDGRHVYDVLFITVIDPLEHAGGFTDEGEEQVLLEWQSNPFDVNLWDSQTELSRYFPNSIRNARFDLMSTEDGRMGLGMNGAEGLPLWQRSTGFIPGIVFGHVKPGRGREVVSSLIRGGFNREFQGRDFILDRYYVTGISTDVTTMFDVENGEPTTIFDDPIIPNEQGDDLSHLTQQTLFDVETVETGKYYKFEDDTHIIADRNANPYR